MMTPVGRGGVGRGTASPRGRPAEGADGQASRLSCNHPMDHVQYLGIGDSRLYVRRFEGSETTANAAFQKLVARYCGRPLAEYAVAPQETVG
jgi:hypothetical protein